MDDARLLERQFGSLGAFCAAQAETVPGGRVLRLAGVTAHLTPSAPERSIVNSVLYASPDALAAALDALATAYAAAGVRAWTVWVAEADARAAAALARAGHALDAAPLAMALELGGDLPAARDGVAIEEPESVAPVAELNDLVYGAQGAFARAFAGMGQAGGHAYLARVEGRPASCVYAFDHDGDCGIYLVATAPAARGRGLASALMARALADARARGCETSTLQATRIGEPLYRRLGYRDLGQVQMWERRAAS